MRYNEFVKELDAEMWKNGKPRKQSGWDKTSRPNDPKDYRPSSVKDLKKPGSVQNLRNIGPEHATDSEIVKRKNK